MSIDIEKKVLSQLLNNVKNYSIIIDRKISNTLFNDRYCQILFDLIYKFYLKYSNNPSRDDLEAAMINQGYVNEDKLSVFALYFEVTNNIDNSSFDYLLDALVEETKKRYLKSSLEKSISCLQNNQLDDLLDVFRSSVVHCEDLSVAKTEDNLIETTEIRRKRYELAKIPDRSKNIMSGFQTLDRVTGGQQPGEFWVIEGWAKAGKSMFLLNYGYNAWVFGKNILYISAELSEIQVARRFDSLSSEVPYNHLKFGALTPENEQYYYKYLDDLKQKKNYFHIVFEAGCSLLNVKQKIKDLTQKAKPDLVIIDYLGICTPVKKYTTRAEEVGGIAWEMANLAKREKIPIITAHQKNRQGQLAGKLGIEYTGESIKVPQHCDNYVAIKVANEDEKKLSTRYDLDVEILVSRDSEVCRFTCEVFSDRMKIVEKTFSNYA